MKTRSNRPKVILAEIAMLLAPIGATQAGPPPDLMNSVWRIHSDAQKCTAAECRSSHSNHGAGTSWSWSRTRDITAGQSSVAIPDMSRIAMPRMKDDPKTAPVHQ